MDCTIWSSIQLHDIQYSTQRVHIKGVLKIYIVFMEIYVFEKLIFSYDFKGDFLCE